MLLRTHVYGKISEVAKDCMWYSHNAPESRCLGFRPFASTHFSTLFRPSLTDSDALWWSRMVGQSASPLSCYCSDDWQLSKALFFLEWIWLLSYFMESDPIQSYNVLYAPKACLYFVKSKLEWFLWHFFRFFCSWHFVCSWDQTGVSHWN